MSSINNQDKAAEIIKLSLDDNKSRTTFLTL